MKMLRKILTVMWYSIDPTAKYSPTSLSWSMESWFSSSSRWPVDKNCQLRACDSCGQASEGGLRNSDRFYKEKSRWHEMTAAVQTCLNRPGQCLFAGMWHSGFTMESLWHSMFHQIIEAQALETWLVLDMTITGRQLVWINTSVIVSQ